MISRGARIVLQLGVTAALLLLLWQLGLGAGLLDRLTGAEPAWLLAGLVWVSAGTVVAAMRWRHTTICVGVEVGLGVAVRELYLALFLNQVLPSGMAGDAVRAWRHGRRAVRERQGGVGSAVRTVIIERVSNVLVVSLLAVTSMMLWSRLPGAMPTVRTWLPLVGVLVVVVAGLAGLVMLARRTGGVIERFTRDLGRVLFAPREAAIQIALGAAVTGTCMGGFYCAVRALGASLSVLELLALVPGVLLAISIPISYGGWGLREAAAVALWGMAGRDGGEALAAAVLYGAVALVASLPGALVLALDRPPSGESSVLAPAEPSEPGAVGGGDVPGPQP
ncbi:lysylphosphatidylglycerol synthase transmembrane domain-containing protein [Haliangium sp.]|uniref:lysylphosphatidylglycerol synthase transmembrane domain-containing protein n=1 Tax=Haliangium sp. TaxID=2663208 RepID=UPI003D0E14DB